MKRMPYFGLALVLLTGLFVSLTWAQDEVMTLKSDALEPHQRPLVRFSHEKHSENIACADCHHDYDEAYNKQGTEGGICSDCHQEKATKENPVPLDLAFHKQCKQCHLFHLNKNTSTGPVMCGGCHVRPARRQSGKK
jgi:hypothetical protein